MRSSRGSGSYAGTEGVDHDRHRLGHPDGVGHLHLAAAGQPGLDDVLGHPAGGVGGGAVHLGGILAAEGTAAVTGHAAVGIHDDLAAGEPGVAVRAADHEPAGRIDEEPGAVVVQADRFQHRLDDLL